MVKKSVTDDLPAMIDLKVTNPLIYLKLWWKKFIKNEGIDIKIRIHLLTTFVILLAIFGGTFGLGLLTSTLRTVPVIKDVIPTPIPPTATPDPWRDTAYAGILRKTAEEKFYLQTGDGQAVTLFVSVNVNLNKYIGKKIFASGRYNKLDDILYVTDASDLEVLIQSSPIPTLSPTPVSSLTPSL
jgi:hypothetical protein